MANPLKELEEKLGNKASANEFERSFYSRDLAPVPDVLSKLLFQSFPEMVVLPSNIDDVVEVMQTACKHQISVTPRAAATTAYLNAVPVRKGIVIDMSSLKGVINVDADNLAVEAYPGTSWKELNVTLKRHGLTALSVPSSGESSTVGGWFSMEGYGIGSMKYGSFHKQVSSAQIVLPHGEIITSTAQGRFPLSWFAGSEGTLGIVTKLSFSVREILEKEVHITIKYSSMTDVKDALSIMGHLDDGSIPYNVHWSNPDFYKMLRGIGYPVTQESHLLLVSYQGSNEHIEAGLQAMKEIAAKTKGEILEDGTGEHEWNERFRSLKIKRGGPTLLAAEVVLPVNSLSNFYKLIENFGQSTAAYGHMMDDNRMVVLVMYYADETKLLDYLFLMAKTQKIYNTAIKLGGRPYGIGVWNSVYLKRSHSPELIEAMRERKRLIDPKNIMNPGKIYGHSKLLNPMIFQFASSSANLASSILGIGKGR
ncbi:MAG: FAD-binding oxidoreductase [Clostridia bacterium]|nr:FAD-binding oxidoreductase [Clostridia bacterium]